MKQAIILAGGLGTRLREVVPDLPKCLAPIAGKPFIGYLIDYLVQQGIQSFIFSLGYRHNLVEEYLHARFRHLAITCVAEPQPLGTGGGLALACRNTTEKQVFVLNGDTMFRIDMQALADFHHVLGGDCTIALKPMKNNLRYGHVIVGNNHEIREYLGKAPEGDPLINGGIYALDVSAFCSLARPGFFSFEKDYLPVVSNSKKLFGMVQDEYFIDIGVPEDYEKAQKELTNPDV